MFGDLGFIGPATFALNFTIAILLFAILKLIASIVLKKRILGVANSVIILMSFIVQMVFICLERFNMPSYKKFWELLPDDIFQAIVLLFLFLHVLLETIQLKAKKMKKKIALSNLLVSTVAFIAAGAMSILSALLLVEIDRAENLAISVSAYEKFISSSVLISDVAIVIYFFIEIVVVPIVEDNLSHYLSTVKKQTGTKI
ncbi:hypothetical protein FACS1894166_09290 [Bacilli bacterium]|nr:hypothetical protein FACS1894166_09290 [Bacilli bacterium]